MDEHGVVEHLDGDRGSQREFHGSAEGAGGGDTEAGTKRPAATARIVGRQIVEVAARFRGRQILEKQRTGCIAILAQHR